MTPLPIATPPSHTGGKEIVINPVCDPIDLRAFRTPDRRPAPPPFGRSRDLPILGRAEGGKHGTLTIADGPIDWTFRPADLQGVQDAFSVFVTGESMVPKYRPRDLVYVHPGKTPRRGRFVLVETVGHKGLIKQFEKWDGDQLVLRQFNPEGEIRLPRADVLRVLLVIGSLDA